MPALHNKFEFVKDENIVDFFQAMGTPKELLDKYATLKPNLEIVLDGKNLSIVSSMNGTRNYILNEEIEEKYRDIPAKSVATTESNGQITIVTTNPEGKKITRKYGPVTADGQLVVVLTGDSLPEAKQYYKQTN